MIPFVEVTNIIKWYFLLEILSFLTFPICFFLFKNLKDNGYSISKTIGFVLLSFIVFTFTTYLKLSYNNLIVYFSLFFLSLLSFLIFLLQKNRIKINKNFLKHALKTEIIYTILFLFFIFLKTFAPDADGGEYVMDFAFVNSINRGGTSFNYPWYAGEKLENLYYYFGHFLTSILINLSGVSPGIGYNLAMVTFFSTFAISCYGIIFNLTGSQKFGILAIIFLVFMGNMYGLLHIFNSIFPSVDIRMPSYKPSVNGDLFQKLTSKGDSDLFWWSTRVIPWTITEVPWFSFLWGDLHAHYISYQFIVMFLAICLNFFLSEKINLKFFGNTLFEKISSIFIISLSLGFLFPEFIWNYPIFAGFTGLFLVSLNFLNAKKIRFSRFVGILITIFLILMLSAVIFFPSFLKLLKPKSGGSITPEYLKTSSYHFLVILFLQWFLILGFLLKKLLEFKFFQNKNIKKILILDVFLYIFLIFILLLSFFNNSSRFFNSDLTFKLNLNYLIFDFQMLSILLPIILISIVLLVSRKFTKSEYFVVLLILMGSFVLLGSEIFSIHGRYVFFFKIFPSVWIMWGIASVYSFYNFRYKLNFKNFGNSVFTIFIFLIIFFSFIPYITIGTCNATDEFKYSFGRNYLSIDALSFMKQVHKSDYDAIYWINQNIRGTPIILEYVGNEYSYSSRVSSFTGLPTLVGWRFHSSQLTGTDVSTRENDVHLIYNTIYNIQSVELLKKYNISYIFVGELENQNYRSESLEKFSKHPEYYNLVYNQSNVKIYEVN